MQPDTSEPSLRPPNIVITGAWRSGTTLLYLLFPCAFADVAASGEESDALDTLLPATSRWRLSKRPNDIHRLRLIHQKIDPYVIYLLRDPRDCIVSWRASRQQYYMGFNEWMRNRLFAESVASAKLLTLRFEDLVLKPDEAQQQILAFIPGLAKRQDLSRCSAEVKSDSPILFQLASGKRSGGTPTVRALDREMVGAWRQDKARIRQQLEQFPELQAALEKYGYEPDDEWQRDL